MLKGSGAGICTHWENTSCIGCFYRKEEGNSVIQRQDWVTGTEEHQGGEKKKKFFLSLLRTTGSREVKERTDVWAGNKGKQEGNITYDRCVWSRTLPGAKGCGGVGVCLDQTVFHCYRMTLCSIFGNIWSVTSLLCRGGLCCHAKNQPAVFEFMCDVAPQVKEYSSTEWRETRPPHPPGRLLYPCPFVWLEFPTLSW